MRSRKTLLCLALVLTACGGGGEARTTTTRATAPRTTGAATPPRAPTATAVAPIPAGYHAITPALVVADVAREIEFFESGLGARSRARITGANGAVMHAEVQIGDSIIMIGDESMEHGQRAPTSAEGSTGGLFVYVPDVDAAVMRAVNSGATATTPPSDMFWGDRFAQVRDPSGHYISFAMHQIDLSQEEMRARGDAAMTAMSSGQPMPTFQGGRPASSWRPEGYQTVTPSIVVSDADAIDFYTRALGARERMRMLMPDGRLMHGEIQIGDSIVMLSGEMPESPTMQTPAHLGASTMTLYHYVPDVDAVFARATEAGARVVMPVREMFWGDRVGSFMDPSQHSWSVATHVRDVSMEEMQTAARRQG